MPTVSSFDIYDTLVVRRTLTERSLYAAVWQQLKADGHTLPTCSRFVELREQASESASGIDAPSLHTLLQHLDAELLPIADQIERAEIALELEQLACVPGALERVRSARESGHTIAFVSDMHISAKHLRPRLEELGLCRDGDLFLVSSDEGVSKSRGGALFETLISLSGCEAAAITHHGNSHWSDDRQARIKGLSTVYCPAANINRYETRILETPDHTGNRVTEALARACRDTRLAMSEHVLEPALAGERERALLDVAASVVGPVMLAFTTWVINRCREQSIQRVCFLTRDGELPLEIARALPSELTAGIELQLLEVSRRSLMLPAASLVSLDDWLNTGMKPSGYLSQHADKLPASSIVGRTGLTFDKHASLLARFGLTSGDAPLGEAGLAQWRNALASPDVRHCIIEESERKLASTTAYFKQHLPELEGKRIALVDIGWTGQQAGLLSTLIRHLGGEHPLHLHLGRLRNHTLIAEAHVVPWLIDEHHAPSPLENPVALFETFCASTEGGVMGYAFDESGHAVAERRQSEHRTRLEHWGHAKMRTAALQLAAQAGPLMSAFDDDGLRHLSIQLLDDFWNRPTHSEARTWGDFPYERDQTGEYIQRLANPYNWQQLQARLNGRYTGLDWKAGSIALSPALLRWALALRERWRGRLA